MNRWKCHTCGASGDAYRDDPHAFKALAAHCATPGHLRAVVEHHDRCAAECRVEAEVHAKRAEDARRKLGLS